jgi:DNA repair protein RadA/Sms
MAKAKEAYICNSCGEQFSKWRGQCSRCGNWNSIDSEPVTIEAVPRASGYAGAVAQVQTLADVAVDQVSRIGTGCGELDRVLGEGGLVPGSCVLLGGHPGAGKSTLLLQMACHLAQSRRVLYVTGEESPAQVAGRAQRLELDLSLSLLAETRVEEIISVAESQQPEILIVDSIQVVYLEALRSAPGSVAQVRESAAHLTRFAKSTSTVLILVGHVTKDGSLAGPKTLEHIIDVSLLLEGGNESRYRTLRSKKNRFGTVNELGIFAMLESGLREVKNPCAIFLSRPAGSFSGSVVTATWEGSRSLLVEVQALVAKTSLEIPRRVAVGVESNRLSMLIAILQKHARLTIGSHDIFVNVVGGVKVQETSADLAIIAALYSSFCDLPIPERVLIFGELGLSGEVRPVPHGGERLQEAQKHGFSSALIPEQNRPRKSLEKFRVISVNHVSDLLSTLGSL